MRREIVDLIIGLVLIIVGIAVMLFVFSTALNLAFSAGDYFREQMPEEETLEGPGAEFRWDSDDFNVTFEDLSEEGDGNIVSYEWDFGDGEQDDIREPDHEYSNEGQYQVSLRIKDENNKRSSARGEISIEVGRQTSGTSQPDYGDIGFDINFGNIILPMAIALLVGALFLVMFLVGAAITKAGWNILKPKPEKLKIKLKPREIEIKQVGTYAPPPPEPVQQAPQQYSPPPPEEYQQE